MICAAGVSVGLPPLPIGQAVRKWNSVITCPDGRPSTSKTLPVHGFTGAVSALDLSLGVRFLDFRGWHTRDHDSAFWVQKRRNTRAGFG